MQQETIRTSTDNLPSGDDNDFGPTQETTHASLEEPITIASGTSSSKGSSLKVPETRVNTDEQLGVETIVSAEQQSINSLGKSPEHMDLPSSIQRISAIVEAIHTEGTHLDFLLLSSIFASNFKFARRTKKPKCRSECSTQPVYHRTISKLEHYQSQ